MTRRLIAVAVAALTVTGTALFGTPAFADEFRDRQWHLKYLRVAEAHKISTGKGVTVAVIDTGVSKHPDLDSSVLKGTDFVNPGGSGQADQDGHGTAMAGLIAAHGKDNRGALGLAPDAKILPIKVLRGDRKVKLELGPAIDYAVKHGAKVINISAGGGTTARTIEAVRGATEADVVIVAAAGNRPGDTGVIAPALFDSVVAVAATDRQGRKSDVSVTGTAIDLAAPGEDMTSTTNRGDYAIEQTGTSDAAAIVSGAAALLRSKYPDMTAEEVVQRLEQTATDKGAPGVDPEYGHGIVNIVAALSDKQAPASDGPSAVPTTQPGTPAPTTTAQARPKADEKSSSSALIIGGIVAVVLLGLGGVFWLRRRRSGGTG
ncbi:type VII secretion-associated serine protease mycosin [Actinoplanes sp. NPDC049316]|uniref:type VII secretion-associated serine protease mycosin n=1 Tax=Actinoplanes sp. NPDC049316 TaxID=3154727 RepID=UPI00341576F4